MHAPNGSTNGPTGARSSTRIKQKSTVAFAKQLKYISMNKDDQVKDLKAKVRRSLRYYVPVSLTLIPLTDRGSRQDPDWRAAPLLPLRGA